MRYYGEHMTFAGYRAVYIESTDDEQETRKASCRCWRKAAASALLPSMRSSISPSRLRGIRRPRWCAHWRKRVRTASTYAPTITTIISRGYVSREKKRLYPTELGYMVTDVMLEYFAPIVDVDFTAQMEKKLDEVEEGQEEWRAVLRDFYPPFEKMLDEAEKHIEKVEIQDEVSDVPCDKCGSDDGL